MFSTVLCAMLASTIPVAIMGVQYAMRVSPFWTPEQFSQYRYVFSREMTLSDHLDSDLYTVSPRGRYAVRERDRGRHGSAELYSERA